MRPIERIRGISEFIPMSHDHSLGIRYSEGKIKLFNQINFLQSGLRPLPAAVIGDDDAVDAILQRPFCIPG